MSSRQEEGFGFGFGVGVGLGRPQSTLDFNLCKAKYFSCAPSSLSPPLSVLLLPACAGFNLVDFLKKQREREKRNIKSIKKRYKKATEKKIQNR